MDESAREPLQSAAEAVMVHKAPGGEINVGVGLSDCRAAEKTRCSNPSHASPNQSFHSQHSAARFGARETKGPA